VLSGAVVDDMVGALDGDLGDFGGEAKSEIGGFCRNVFSEVKSDIPEVTHQDLCNRVLCASFERIFGRLVQELFPMLAVDLF
jgi:hypothetical protein